MLQEVSTRWNSQLLCMRSCLKSEGAIRAVVGLEEFRSMKSLVGSLFFLLLNMKNVCPGRGQVWSSSSGVIEETVSCSSTFL